MTARYKNSFSDEAGPDFYETDVKPESYKGYLIYQRIRGAVWDIVDGGVCVAQFAGSNGAKRFIDNVLIPQLGQRGTA